MISGNFFIVKVIKVKISIKRLHLFLAQTSVLYPSHYKLQNSVLANHSQKPLFSHCWRKCFTYYFIPFFLYLLDYGFCIAHLRMIYHYKPLKLSFAFNIQFFIILNEFVKIFVHELTLLNNLLSIDHCKFPYYCTVIKIFNQIAYLFAKTPIYTFIQRLSINFYIRISAKL